jgi:hypothetical protein
MKNRPSKAKLIPITQAGATRPLPEAEAPQKNSPMVPTFPEVLHVDGKRVAIEGADEIELRCGEASITLRRNGKIIIKGTYVESSSKGVNRVKGGAIKIN